MNSEEVKTIGAVPPNFSKSFLLVGAVFVPIIYFAFGLAYALGTAIGFAIFSAWFAYMERKDALFVKSIDSVVCRRGYVEVYYLGPSRHGPRGTLFFTPADGESVGPPEPGEYAVVVDRGKFYIRAFGCRVERGRFRGYMLARLDPSKAKSLSGELSASSPQGDYARAVLKPVGPGQVEVTLDAHLVEARAARLELVVETPLRTYWRIARPIESRVVLAESRGGTVRNVVDLRGTSRPVLLAIEGYPWLSKEAPFSRGVAGLGPGPYYRLRLVLDRPRARDVVVEQDVTPA